MGEPVILACQSTSPAGHLRDAWTMPPVSVNHYENFPVASVLCPSRLRPAIAAIYWYARTADDLADEGTQLPAERLASLAAYRADLRAVASGYAPSGRWRQVFESLARAMDEFTLPLHLLEDLLSAFEQDVTKTRYVDRMELLDYTRRSANPVGRLLLHLYRIDDDESLRRSDAICSSLQLINFWQDLSVDTRRGRLYVPLDACHRHRVPAASLLARNETPTTRGLLREMVDWARQLMHAGAPLAVALPGRIGWELRLVVQGGLRVLEKIERIDYATLQARPVLRPCDGPMMLWRSLWM